MQIKCSFTLEPEIYEHHRDAASSLRQWKKQLQASNDNVEIARERVNNFHRQIYLSGLYLHNLAPELPLILSQNFTQNVELKTFVNLLAAVGVTADITTAAPSPTEAILSEQQWQKLTGLVSDIKTQQSQVVEQQNVTATPDDALLFTLQQNQTKALAQLKAIRSQIDKLSSGGMGSVEKDEVPDLDDQLAKASRVKAKGLW